MSELPDRLYSVYLQHRKVVTDSRIVTEGSIFFALKGDTFNGNEYAATAIAAGAELAVIDDPAYQTEKTLLVPDVLSSLQDLARMYRASWSLPVIGITGSNGKTTTKELLNAVLGSHYKVHCTQGNLNNHIGVPLTILSAPPGSEIIIIEMGANHPGEIRALCSIANPLFGLITNIGKAHLEGFGGFEGVIRTKNELYQHIAGQEGKLFVNGDNPLLMELSSGIERILYGQNDSFFVSGMPVMSGNFLNVNWKLPAGDSIVETQLVGDYNFENVMAALCLGCYFNVPDHKMISAISNYQPSNNRSQTIATGSNLVIMDAYNANPSSMQAALRNFGQLKAGNKVAILGDMLELGTESGQEHVSILDLAVSLNLEQILLVGPEFQKVAGSLPAYPDAGSALAWLKDHPLREKTILIKGSRGIRLEKILEAL